MRFKNNMLRNYASLISVLVAVPSNMKLNANS